MMGSAEIAAAAKTNPVTVRKDSRLGRQRRIQGKSREDVKQNGKWQGVSHASIVCAPRQNPQKTDQDDEDHKSGGMPFLRKPAAGEQEDSQNNQQQRAQRKFGGKNAREEIPGRVSVIHVAVEQSGFDPSFNARSNCVGEAPNIGPWQQVRAGQPGENDPLDGRVEIGNLLRQRAIEDLHGGGAFGKTKKIEAPQDRECAEQYSGELGETPGTAVRGLRGRNETSHHKTDQGEQDSENRSGMLSGQSHSKHCGCRY